MKLHELKISNFKFFQEVEPNNPLLHINGRNLLIYGENGSGKSTIYWALYTLLESSLKERDSDIRKYFIKSGNDSLVNIFSSSRNDSYVEAVLKDNLSTKIYRVSKKSRDLSIRGNADVQESSMASDFINYRVLFQLHNLKHSKSNNLWLWFVEEVLPYIKVNNDPCLELLKKLKNGPEKVKNIHGEFVFPTATLRTSRIEQEAKNYKKYREFKKNLKKWNDWLVAFLNDITLRANEFIQNEFKYKFKIQIDIKQKTFVVSENEFKFFDPEIIISISDFQGINAPHIKKPHTFLNEAKWSAIGLSIRFAVLDIKLYSAELKTLVIDDMLLSLDMSNRDVVLDLLLNRYSADYQLIFMTHDRFLFELTKSKISSLGQNNWMCLDMFENENGGRPKPLIIERKNLIQKAWALFYARELDSSANTLRKASEKLCKSYLTKQERLNTNYSLKTLHEMIEAFRVKGASNGLDIIKLNQLMDYKNRILNSSSHYDIETPIFKVELEKAINIVEELSNELGYNI